MIALCTDVNKNITNVTCIGTRTRAYLLAANCVKKKEVDTYMSIRPPPSLALFHFAMANIFLRIFFVA